MAPEPDTEISAWLGRERERRGWDMPAMARHLVDAARANGDNAVPDDAKVMTVSAYRWERTGRLSDRYKRHYCRAFGIAPGQFGKPDPRDTATAPPGTAAPAVPALSPEVLMPDLPGPHLPPSIIMAYRGRQEPGSGELAVRQEVMMAAHESSDHAAEDEQHAAIGEFTFGQLRAEVVRLSRQTDTGSPLPAFVDLRRVRDRIYTLLDRRLWPREQSDLYFLLGCVNGLMGVTANRLGYPDAAEELLRAGWAYASIIEHNALRGMLRLELSSVAYHRGRYSESRDMAADGLRYISQGSRGAQLYVWHARAAARLGDLDMARQSVALADAARDSDYTDDVTEIGGNFAISWATHHAQAGYGLTDASGAERDAAVKLEQAISLYDAGPGEDEDFWFAGKPLASVNLAVVSLRSGALDGAAAALESALALPAEQRISDITVRLADVRRELAAPIFQRSPQARDLGEAIETFGREAVASGLHSLTG